ncbi:MAG: hypothetical protein Q9169_003285 [Polycauliona sp. 2 TL-2023]
MESAISKVELPNPDSPELQLTQATSHECTKVWANTSASWRDTLTLPVYLQEQLYLSGCPLARDGGMTTWILVEKNFPPDNRRIFCSCESYRKRSLMTDASGQVEEVIVHGVASVFCPTEYRRRGYAARHMQELAKALSNWQSHQARVAGSVLYSDIGKAYYARVGWKPGASNWHVEFPPINAPKSSIAREIIEDDIGGLCRRDEVIIRDAMAAPTDVLRKAVTILPDLDHMLWHIRKEDFATDQLFGRKPRAKGAIAGMPGHQAWAIWSHRYYMQPNAESAGNVLYILRLVVEGDDTANRPSLRRKNKSQEEEQERQAESLFAVIQCAQAEAAEWQLNHVKLWEPTPWVRDVIAKSNISQRIVEREEDSVASCLWYDEEPVGHDSSLITSLSYPVIIRLLFQFHKQQNSKKPGSVHAVYLVSGYLIPVTPVNSSSQNGQVDGGDAHMQSSPFMSSSMPQPEDEEDQLAVKTVTLCREEDLEGEIDLH